MQMSKRLVQVVHGSFIHNSSKFEITQTHQQEWTNYEYSHNTILLKNTKTKKNELLRYVTTWMDFKIIM